MNSPENFYQNFQDSVFLLIQNTSTALPKDVQAAMLQAQQQEKEHSNAKFSLETIEENIALAEQKTVPICQDTGFPTFYIEYSPEKFSFSQKKIKAAVFAATEKATQKGILRPNAVDSLTGKNSGNNCGEAIPKVVFTEIDEEESAENLTIKLLLKGGGSENVSFQHALPCQTDFGKAGRDGEGVKKAVLQTVKNAEGKGCAPGIVSVHIGGDRGTGYDEAKKNFFRTLQTQNPHPELEKLEKEILEESNHLGIGPMGFGGKSTVLDVFCSASHRIPASFFVTVSYSCWALRRGQISCDEKGSIQNNISENILQNIPEKKEKNVNLKNFQKKNEGNSKHLTFPLSEDDIENIVVGDKILLSGTIYTGRDTLHHYVVEEKKSLPKNISGSAIYHCGPVMQKFSGKNNTTEWKAVSAGPTTSIREEPYQSEFIEKTGIRGIIGKGGMGEQTLAGLKKHKAVYFHAIGGAAAVYAEKITAVKGVYFLEEFGVPEAMWELEIKDFPVIVTMDAHGKTLY
jgi:fumarate hydratase class I